jgi:hypothetical protein
MRNPLTFNEAKARGLLMPKGIHTFSSGSEWDGWASDNCFDCWHFDPDVAGAKCAFESAAFLGMVTPDLARMFGWIQATEQYGPLSGWRSPETCAFFRARTDDDGEDNPPPPEPDPRQLVLIADPTEDLALAATMRPERAPAIAVDRSRSIPAIACAVSTYTVMAPEPRAR